MRFRVVLCGISLVSIAGLGWWLYANRPQPTQATNAAVAQSQPNTEAKPTIPLPAAVIDMQTPQRLLIPKLAIDQPIRKVGLLANGEMAMPDDLQTVGWYGAVPGNAGKAVLAAHTGFPSKPSVFRKLDQLVVGDALKVRDSANTEAEFEVTRVAQYTPQDAPRQQIFGDSPTQRLTLITCIGKWDAKTQSYSHRLIISAVRKS